MDNINWVSKGKQLGFKPIEGKEKEFGEAVKRYVDAKWASHGICFRSDLSSEEIDQAYKDKDDAYEAIKEFSSTWRGKSRRKKAK